MNDFLEENTAGLLLSYQGIFYGNYSGAYRGLKENSNTLSELATREDAAHIMVQRYLSELNSDSPDPSCLQALEILLALENFRKKLSEYDELLLRKAMILNKEEYQSNALLYEKASFESDLEAWEMKQFGDYQIVETKDIFQLSPTDLSLLNKDRIELWSFWYYAELIYPEDIINERKLELCLVYQLPPEKNDERIGIVSFTSDGSIYLDDGSSFHQITKIK